MRIEIASIDVVSEVNMVSSGGTGSRGAEPSALWRRLPAAPQRRDSFASGLRRQHEFARPPAAASGLLRVSPDSGLPTARESTCCTIAEHVGVARKSYLCCWSKICMLKLALRKCSLPCSKCLQQV